MPKIVSPQLAGGLGEADDAVEAVVIGEGERLEAEAGRLGDELLGMRRPVEDESWSGSAARRRAPGRCRATVAR